MVPERYFGQGSLDNTLNPRSDSYTDNSQGDDLS